VKSSNSKNTGKKCSKPLSSNHIPGIAHYKNLPENKPEKDRKKSPFQIFLPGSGKKSG